MACDLWREQLGAFVDGELPDDAVREFTAHLQECPSCAADIAGYGQLKAAVKRASLRRFAPSAEFRQQIEMQLGRRSTRRAPWAWPAFAAAAALLIALLWLPRLGTNSTASTMSEVVDLHVAALASANPVDVVSTDLHTVKPWFEGKLPFAVNLPDLDNTPFALLGGRLAYMHQAPGAGLLFQSRKHRLSAFIFQDQQAWRNLGGRSEPKQYASFWIETWEQGGLRYFVVGDTSAENVRQLSNLIRDAAGAK
jgi:anti-sigma factor RsiW